MSVWNKKIESWDTLIKQGKGSIVRSNLTDLKLSQVPRAHLQAIANLAWRISYPQLAIRALYPVIRPINPHLKPASDLEKADYAIALSQIGVDYEALGLLKEIDPKACNKALLYSAFVLFKSWNYPAAIPYLEEYLKHADDEYQIRVAKVNLCAAYLNSNQGYLAKPLIEEVMEFSKRGNLDLLFGNSNELMAQVYFQDQNYEMANQYLDQAHKILENMKGVSLVYVEKWQAIVNLIQNKENSIEVFKSLRQKALEINEWETLRDFDYHYALIKSDQNLFDRCFFGSPYSVFREKLQFNIGLKPSDSFILSSFEKRKEKLNTVSLSTGETSDKAILNPGKLLHRLLKVLCADFYRPCTVGSLHSQMFPHEYFSPESSPNRVYNVIQRFRSWSEKLPLKLEQSSGNYRLFFDGNFGIKIDLDDLGYSMHETENVYYLKQVKTHWPETSFTAQQLSELMTVNKRTANRVIKKLIEEGQLEKIGAGPKTAFKLVS